MRVVQVAGDEIVDVVAVGKRLVTAALPVLVAGRMPGAGVIRHAPIRIGSADRKAMVVDVTAVHMVKVSFVQVIGVSFMADRRMAAAASVDVAHMIRMF
jgi:hypothetical protein